jgi:hydroxyethylthiazole kinase-like sugar kinase family protein
VNTSKREEVNPMANETEGFLINEVTLQEKRMKVMAARLEELASIDCPLGVCIVDPMMQTVEHEIDEIQHRKNIVEDALRAVRQQAV